MNELTQHVWLYHCIIFDRAVARTLIGGFIFIYSGSARLVSFEIELIIAHKNCMWALYDVKRRSPCAYPSLVFWLIPKLCYIYRVYKKKGNRTLECSSAFIIYIIYRNPSFTVGRIRLLAFECHHFCEIWRKIEQSFICHEKQLTSLIRCINFTT